MKPLCFTFFAQNEIPYPLFRLIFRVISSMKRNVRKENNLKKRMANLYCEKSISIVFFFSHGYRESSDRPIARCSVWKKVHITSQFIFIILSTFSLGTLFSIPCIINWYSSWTQISICNIWNRIVALPWKQFLNCVLKNLENVDLSFNRKLNLILLVGVVQ